MYPRSTGSDTADRTSPTRITPLNGTGEKVVRKDGHVVDCQVSSADVDREIAPVVHIPLSWR
jgi:hypothetical protein